MKTVDYDKDIRALILILVCLVGVLGYVTFVKFTYKSNTSGGESGGGGEVVIDNTNLFNGSFISNVDAVAGTDNYLVSPYSVEVALNMLKEGADGTTLDEINSVITEGTISTFDIKDRIGIANALFIKNMYKDYVNEDFVSSLSNMYGAEIIYDEFNTPDEINKWCKEKTWDMIDKVVDDISKDYVLGIANAVAIDVDWKQSFECNNTTSGEFSKSDGSIMNVEMMHNTYSSDVKYFENDDYTGVVIPYSSYDSNGEISEDGSNLEFVGILPTGSISDFISNNSTLDNIANDATEASSDKNVVVSLPRFSYSYELSDFASVLKSMGIASVFDSVNADLTKIISRDDMSSLGIENLYVSKAVHKTYIDLNEKGTKAAAVTYLQIEKNSVDVEESEKFEIEFNKPFVFMIRDSVTKEMLFFGTVYTPNEWKGSTCSNNE